MREFHHHLCASARRRSAANIAGTSSTLMTSVIIGRFILPLASASIVSSNSADRNQARN